MTDRPRIYISGPMSGLPREEYLRRFREREVLLTWDGYRVVNPARLAPCRWPWLYRLLGYRRTIAYDLYWLRRCTHIYMLPGWRQSRGARLEHRLATRLGLTVIDETGENAP